MKKTTIYSLLIILFMGLNLNAQSTINTKDYALFGEKFEASKVLTEKQMLKKYKNLKAGDSIAVKFLTNIKAVCKKKGCWMKLDLSNGEEAFVKFKDYAFFVPLNADNSQAVVNGYAFVKVVSVDELRHYAKDAGKSKEEINKIKKPEVTYSFMADGVYIKKS
jgi:hypothetical protein